MLALIFRGIFFMGVVGWYSTSLWKMIDGYFKEQFQRYLEEEYQRNPKMREDVRVHATVDKTESLITDDTIQSELQRLLGSCDLNSDDDQLGTCSAGKVDSSYEAWREEDESVPTANTFAAGAVIEEVGKEVARPVDAKDEPAFRERPREDDDGHAAKPPDELDVLGRTLDIEIKQKTSNPDKAQQQSSVTLEPESKQKQSHIRKKRKSNGRPQIGAAKSAEDAMRKKKRYDKIRTLTLTDEDFDSASRKRRFTDGRSHDDDQDFSEFDEENNRALKENYDNEEETVTGIPVADLPFKPLIDIYDLERFSAEEFCPLTLKDDPSCEETRSWP